MKIDFKDKSDDELIRIMDDQTSSNITNTVRTGAKIELHKRQSNIDKSTNVLSRWIFFLTLFIAIPTCIFLLQWCSSFTQPKESAGIQHLTDTHDTKKKITKPKAEQSKMANKHKTSSQQFTSADRNSPVLLANAFGRRLTSTLASRRS
jgi:hypothetical protein